MIIELIFNANLQYIDSSGQLFKVESKESILDRETIDFYLNFIKENNFPAPKNQDDPNDLFEKIMNAYFHFLTDSCSDPESPENKIDYELISFKTDEVGDKNEQ